ncbi:hypothetical protein HY626_03440 [Candidatus Uhrbacteria bacterium]|nr:hypothetical protein [Candidatus Uhrbacteria bacterium]
MMNERYFVYRTFTFFGSAFQQILLYIHVTTRSWKETDMEPYNTYLSQRLPSFATACTIGTSTYHACHDFMRAVWTVPRSLAATKGMESLFVSIRRDHG